MYTLGIAGSKSITSGTISVRTTKVQVDGKFLRGQQVPSLQDISCRKVSVVLSSFLHPVLHATEIKPSLDTSKVTE